MVHKSTLFFKNWAYYSHLDTAMNAFCYFTPEE
uniref:Uncharacterized protein n=1 Tax=Anguilla anguilla TaxID=7936 RepID=A0A0E9WKL3_ANGAN